MPKTMAAWVFSDLFVCSPGMLPSCYSNPEYVISVGHSTVQKKFFLADSLFLKHLFKYQVNQCFSIILHQLLPSEL
jgi:hypothetical protein